MLTEGESKVNRSYRDDVDTYSCPLWNLVNTLPVAFRVWAEHGIFVFRRHLMLLW